MGPEPENQLEGVIIDQILPDLILLRKYDDGKVSEAQLPQEKLQIGIDKVYSIIERVKKVLNKRGEKIELFALENNPGKFASIVESIYQVFDNQLLYPTFEEKAANLFYFIIKDHPFVDGNKRVGVVVVNYYYSLNFLAWNQEFVSTLPPIIKGIKPLIRYGAIKLNHGQLTNMFPITNEKLAKFVAESKPSDRKRVVTILIENIRDTHNKNMALISSD